MSKPFLRFEDGRIVIDNKEIMVNSANLSINPSLNQNRVYGNYDAQLRGAKTEFVDFSPGNNLAGKLSISFYISAETFAENGNPNNVSRIFDIKRGMNEAPINNNIVGRYSFDNMFLRSFSFNLRPYSLLEASAEYDIYGTIHREVDRFFVKNDVNFAHALKSFGRMEVGTAPVGNAIDRRFEIAGMSFNINVERKINNAIRANENTAVNTTADGPIPFRVSVEQIESEMNVESNEIIDDLNVYGSQQKSTVVNKDQTSKIVAYLYSLQQQRIARFEVDGKIMNQSVNISENSLAKSAITVREVIK